MTLATARWLMVVVPASLYFFSYFHRVAPAVVAQDLMRDFGIPAASLGTLAAIYPYVFSAMALVAGSLADTLGPRWTLTLGGATMGLGAALFGLAPTFAVAFVGRLLVGLGASVMLIAWLALAAEWFRADEFGTFSGMTQTIGNAGALVASSPLALVVEAAGWRLTFVSIGVLTLLLAAVAATLVRDTPSAMGLPAVNPGRGARRAEPLGEVLRAARGVVTNGRTWPPVLAAGGVYASAIAFQGLWGIPYLTQIYGLPRVSAATVIAMIGVGFGVGSPLIGRLSDRWLGRRRLPMLVSGAVYALAWLFLALPAEPMIPRALLMPFFFLLGLGSSGLVLVWSCVREVNDPTRVGVAVGFCNMPIFLGFAILQWLTGVILDAHWTGGMLGGARAYPVAAYRSAFLVCFGAALAGVVAAALVTETRCRNIWMGGPRNGPPTI
ncbi:MAG: MFS transporter [Candidatus Rokuibacteriota bacterium]